MKKLLNVLYVTSSDAFLNLENENVVITKDGETALKIPLLNLQGIVCFNYFGATSAFMGECAKRNISLSFLDQFGRFVGTLYGETKGNVLLRKEQYRISDDSKRALFYAKNFIFGKIYNQKWVLERATRDNSLRINEDKFSANISQLDLNLKKSRVCEDADSLRAAEGNAAQAYFRCFDDLILQNKDYFVFNNRVRRPPTDPVNALLSFVYTLLAFDCRNALECVGLDSYVGFMHTDRSGRASLSLDLMEELRPHFADRFVLSLINRKEIVKQDFSVQEAGAFMLTDDGRKKLLIKWQQRKKEMVLHPFLKEKIEWGLVPYAQALLLSRAIRGDLDGYPPFLWK